MSRSDVSGPKRRRPTRRSNPIVIGASAIGGLLFIVIGVAAIMQFSKRGDPRLLGTWQSDADATIAEMKKNRPVTDQQEQALRKLFGKMKLTYSAKTVTSELDGTVDTQPYQIVRKEGDAIVVKSWSALSKKDEEYRINFVGPDTYWVEVPQFSLTECFRRIP
jgi:hypothetical protein